jgi:hypothetical protein
VARKILTGPMLEYMTICFRNIIPEYLDDGHRERYLSIKQQFEFDYKLSVAQTDVIRRYKLVSDYKKRELFLAENSTFDKEILAYRAQRRAYKKTGRY